MVSNADCARGAMDLMCRHGSNTSFKRESRLAECWRDLHTVGQTVTLAPEWYPIGDTWEWTQARECANRHATQRSPTERLGCEQWRLAGCCRQHTNKDD